MYLSFSFQRVHLSGLETVKTEVHTDERSIERNRGPVGDDPLGVVAHRQRNSVAGTDAVFFA